jgi:hypothetical protein
VLQVFVSGVWLVMALLAWLLGCLVAWYGAMPTHILILMDPTSIEMHLPLFGSWLGMYIYGPCVLDVQNSKHVWIGLNCTVLYRTVLLYRIILSASRLRLDSDSGSDSDSDSAISLPSGAQSGLDCWTTGLRVVLSMRMRMHAHGQRGEV